jgi:hypothetical protein
VKAGLAGTFKPAAVLQMLPAMLKSKPKGPDKFVAILSDLGTQLTVMDRYERRGANSPSGTLTLRDKTR